MTGVSGRRLSIYKANWNRKEKVLHIASKRCRNRTDSLTEIQAFSNCGEAELFVNGRSMGKCSPDEVCVVTWKNRFCMR